MNNNNQAASSQLKEALDFQARILEGVSRTFALTIPSLPEALRVPVTNAYLLCRIADTIEDDAALDSDRKHEFGRQFVAVVRGDSSAGEFAAGLAPLLGSMTLDAERELIARTPDVIRVTQSFTSAQQTALLRCVSLMSDGMHRFQQEAGLHGLASMASMDQYCYYVAGVVGEMLTELFCEYSPAVETRRDRLMELAPSFGQGLQMTNILKDIWDDRSRGVCWLPRTEFGLDPEGDSDLVDTIDQPAFAAGLERLVVTAHGHLRSALEYTLLIPRRHRGIRRFCLWALGMAVPTLCNIHERSGFRAGHEVKITRREVRRIVRTYGLFAGNDRMLRWLFKRASAGLPRSGPEIAARLEGKARVAGASAETRDSDRFRTSVGAG